MCAQKGVALSITYFNFSTTPKVPMHLYYMHIIPIMIRRVQTNQMLIIVLSQFINTAMFNVSHSVIHYLKF